MNCAYLVTYRKSGLGSRRFITTDLDQSLDHMTALAYSGQCVELKWEKISNPQDETLIKIRQRLK